MSKYIKSNRIVVSLIQDNGKMADIQYIVGCTDCGKEKDDHIEVGITENIEATFDAIITEGLALAKKHENATEIV